MNRLRVLVPVLLAAVIATGWLQGQDKDVPPKNRKLPTYWSKLGLSDEQKKDAMKLIFKYGGQIDQLDQKIKDLKREEKGELDKILTPAQKDRLREILLGEKPTEKPKDKDKAPDKSKDKAPDKSKDKDKVKDKSPS